MPTLFLFLFWGGDPGTEEETRSFMAACIQTLSKHRDGPTPLYIFEQLCNIVSPAKAVPDRLLVCFWMSFLGKFEIYSLALKPVIGFEKRGIWCPRTFNPWGVQFDSNHMPHMI